VLLKRQQVHCEVVHFDKLSTRSTDNNTREITINLSAGNTSCICDYVIDEYLSQKQ